MSAEFDPAAHDQQIEQGYARLQKYALFDELIDYALDGVVSLDEAVKQFKHDAAELEHE